MADERRTIQPVANPFADGPQASFGGGGGAAAAPAPQDGTWSPMANPTSLIGGAYKYQDPASLGPVTYTSGNSQANPNVYEPAGAPVPHAPAPTSPSNTAVFGGSTSANRVTAAPPSPALVQTPGLINGAAGSAYGTGLNTYSLGANDTVEQRAARIAAGDSVLMQQARGAAMQRANERGLINSSLGIQAGQAAVLDRATDIAKQDAAASVDVGKFNANQANSWNLAQAELGQRADQFTRQLDSQNSQFSRDLQFKYDSAKQNADNARMMAELENKYSAQLANDAAFNQQYRDYVNALLVIDSNKDLDAAAKQALKFEQAKILETYALVRGLGLNLDFSSQYRQGMGTGSGSGGADGGSTGPPGLGSGEGSFGSTTGGNGYGGGFGGGIGTGGTAGSVGNGPGSVQGNSVSAGQIGFGLSAIGAATGIPGLSTIGNLTGFNAAAATQATNSIGAANAASVAATSPSGMSPAGLAAGIDSAPTQGFTQGTAAAISAADAARGVPGVTGVVAQSIAANAFSNAKAEGLDDAAAAQAAQAAVSAALGFNTGVAAPTSEGNGSDGVAYGGGWSASGGLSTGGAGGGGYDDGSGPGGRGNGLGNGVGGGFSSSGGFSSGGAGGGGYADGSGGWGYGGGGFGGFGGYGPGGGGFGTGAGGAGGGTGGSGD